jgi:hypothetical protein
MKKARDYRSKYSGGSNSGPSRSRGLRNGERYKLSDRSHDKSAFVSANKSGSEENILDNGAILKSVTYSVQIDEGSKSRPSGRRDDEV